MGRFEQESEYDYEIASSSYGESQLLAPEGSQHFGVERRNGRG